MSNLVIAATAAGPCGCCTGGGGGELTDCFSCRAKGPTATLCGYPEFVPLDEDGEDAPCNTPGKIYRKMSYAGSLTVCTFSTPGCDDADLITSVIASYSGACEKDVDDCTQISTASVSRQTSHTACGGSGSTAVTAECPGIASESGSSFDVAITGDCTVKTVTGTAECIDDIFGNSSYASGTATITLSEEDTEADAIARLLAGVSWSDWGADCVAGYEARTGTSFGYVAVQFRIALTGLTPSTSYDVDVNIYRRTYGVGSYTLYSTITVTGTTDGSGNLNIIDDYPNDVGYETKALCDCVATLS